MDETFFFFGCIYYTVAIRAKKECNRVHNMEHNSFFRIKTFVNSLHIFLHYTL